MIQDQPAILVLPSYNVVCGNVTDDGVSTWITIANASTLRRWGTAKRGGGGGLGLLAREGKQPQTVLDAEGDVMIPRSNVIKMILVEESARITLGL